jgi:8-oxo-dGDP phosphatase
MGAMSDAAQVEPELITDPSQLVDAPSHRSVLASSTVYEGPIWSVRQDRLDLGGGGGVVERDVVVHPGAVAVLAIDDAERVLLVQQYRHPVGALMWELPAGLRDVADEPVETTGRRELAEETGHEAARWSSLVRLHTTPGGSSELLEILLARDITPITEHGLDDREAEEHGMRVAWAPLDLLVAKVLACELTNPSLVAGVLAARLRLGAEEPGQPS